MTLALRRLPVWLPVLLSVEPTYAYEYVHGDAGLKPLVYDAGFPHFSYVSPEAPKGGIIRIPEFGTFDSFNNVPDKGRVAAGLAFYGVGNLVYDTLVEHGADGSGGYGRLADGIWIAENRRQFAYRIRDGAYWHDGRCRLHLQDLPETRVDGDQNDHAGRGHHRTR